jgi:hypothetical protein
MIARAKILEDLIKLMKGRKIASRTILRIELMNPILRRKYNLTQVEIEEIINRSLFIDSLDGLKKMMPLKTIYTVDFEKALPPAERRVLQKERVDLMQKVFPDVKFSSTAPQPMRSIQIKGQDQPLAIYNNTVIPVTADSKVLTFINAYREVERTISGDYLRFNFMKEYTSLSYHEIFGIVKALESEGRATLKADRGGNITYFKAKVPKGVKALKVNVMEALRAKGSKDYTALETDVPTIVRQAAVKKQKKLTEVDLDALDEHPPKKIRKRPKIAICGQVLPQQLFEGEGTVADIILIQRERVKIMQKYYGGVRFSDAPYPESEEKYSNVKGMMQPRAAMVEGMKVANGRDKESLKKVFRTYLDVVAMTPGNKGYVTFNSLQEYSGLSYDTLFACMDTINSINPKGFLVAKDRKGFTVGVKIVDLQDWAKKLSETTGKYINEYGLAGIEGLLTTGKVSKAEQVFEGKVAGSKKNRTSIGNRSGILPPQIELDNSNLKPAHDRQLQRVSAMQKMYPGIHFSPEPYKAEIEKYNYIPGALQPRAIFNPIYKELNELRIVRKVFDSYLKAERQMPGSNGFISFNVIVEDTKLTYAEVFGSIIKFARLTDRSILSFTTDTHGFRVEFKLNNVSKLDALLQLSAEETVPKKEMDDIDRVLADDTPLVLKKVPKHKKQTI